MHINIQTAFYDDVQRQAFEDNYPTQYEKLKNFVEAGMNTFSYADFQAYYLFMFWADGCTNWGSFQGIRQQVSGQWIGLIAFFKHDITTSHFNSLRTHNNERPEHSEGVGVSGALTLLASHHNLIEADWERIPITKKKDFDYGIRIASTGTEFIYVECKGAITTDNSRKPSSVSKHKASIIQKKVVQRPSSSIPSNGIHYGIITVADPSNHLQSWFVDPPVPENADDPRKYKLLARLYFYYRNLFAIYQRSPFVVALINRIKVLENALDYEVFDKLHLVTAAGENFYKSRVFLQGYASGDAPERSQVFGKAVLLGEPDASGQLLFFGFLREVLGYLANQNMNDIISFSLSRAQSRSQKLEFMFTDDTQNGFRLNMSVSKNSPEAKFITALGIASAGERKSAYVSFSCTVDLQLSSAGRAFGLIRTDSIQLR